ncbi:MAG: ClpXP protease specificity-enhancing factor [Gammaproteobacteria bacterium]|nr:ClpXP protease specificity-enhancing factor [Gammaproteobacteria bacterium]
MTPTRPYFVRALYDWIIDNNMTPQVLVRVDADTVHVPMQYVQEGRIVLNVSPSAVRELSLGNELVEFQARFAGTPHQVSFPTDCVLAVFARENGAGMTFPEEPDGPGGPDSPGPQSPDDGSGPSGSESAKGRPTLKLVK